MEFPITFDTVTDLWARRSGNAFCPQKVSKRHLPDIFREKEPKIEAALLLSCGHFKAQNSQGQNAIQVF